MKYIYIGVILLCLVALSLCGYYWLGGFDDIEVQEVENLSFSIAGKPYRGKFYRADSLQDIQEDVANLILSENFNGDFAEVNYINTGTSEEEVDLFLGVVFFEDAIQIPGDFKVRNFNARKFLAVKLNMYHAVRPSVEKVQKILYDYAKEKNYQVEEYFVSITFKDNSLEIYVPVKD